MAATESLHLTTPTHTNQLGVATTHQQHQIRSLRWVLGQLHGGEMSL